jgi:hypothetical protein
MASINDAYQPILLNKFPENISKDNIVGVLLGRVINNAYYINVDKDGKTYYTVNDENKKIKLDITPEDHGKEIELPLMGTRYKITFYNSPYRVK